jgi:hypothetical protein
MLLSRSFVSEWAREAVAAGAYWCSGLRRPDDGPASPLLDRTAPLVPRRLPLALLPDRPREEAPAAEAPVVLGESDERPASVACGRLSVTCRGPE